METESQPMQPVLYVDAVGKTAEAANKTDRLHAFHRIVQRVIAIEVITRTTSEKDL